MFSGKSFCKEEAPSQVFVEFTIIPSWWLERITKKWIISQFIQKAYII
jgi:hypothetical protein